MNFAGILAGGIGSRMGNTQMPKQFLLIGEKPILIHTIEKFNNCIDINKIVVAVPSDWIVYTKNLINKYIKTDKVNVIAGGDNRNDTILNICKYINNNYKLEDNDIIITHDAVRPFITQRIIKDNITKCIEYGATDTVVPATDTIVEAKDNTIISNIPIRNIMYQGQTPQSFKILEFMDISNKLSNEEKEILTDACKIYVLKNKKVGLVEGELSNIKITTAYDLKMANLIANNIQDLL